MDKNIVAVCHTATESEADFAIAALSDGGINASKQYKNAPGGSTLFAFPNAMGFGASEGYDILVVKEAENAARDILIGAGFVQPDEEEEAAEIQESETTEEPAAETSQSEEKTAQPEENSSKGSTLLMILFLVAAGLFVIGVDKLIELIKSFF